MSDRYTGAAPGEDISKPDVVNCISSSDSVTSPTSNRKFLYFVGCTANLAALLNGITFGWTSPEIPKFKESGSPLDVLLTGDQESWIGSLLPLGAVVGPFFAGLVADKIGRKNTLLIGAIPFAVAFVLACIARTVWYLFILRFLCGLGVGINYTVLPMYIAEISDDQVRGQLGSLMLLFINFGIIFSYSAGPYLSILYFNSSCLVVSVLYFILLFVVLPESPYYLVQVNKMEQAEASLMKLRSTSAKEVKCELDRISTSIEASNASRACFMEIFATRSTTKAFVISLCLVVFQQLSGIDVILFYAQHIFDTAESTFAPEISAILIGVVQIISSTIPSMFVEKTGKRILLLISAAGMSLSLAVLAYYFYLKEGNKDVSSISWLPLACLLSFIVLFSLGFGCLPFTVMGELFPVNIKSVASTCCASCCWFSDFLLTKNFENVSDHIGLSGSFGFISLFSLVAAIFTLFCLPETTGRSLQEIQEMLSK